MRARFSWAVKVLPSRAARLAEYEREPSPVDEQPDDDLRIDASLREEPDLAQVVFLLRF